MRVFGTSSSHKAGGRTTFEVTPARAGLVFVGGALSARWVYQTFLLDPARDDDGYRIRRDGSHATVLLQPSPAAPTHPLTMDHIDEDTKTLHKVSAATFANFCREQRTVLERNRRDSEQKARERLRDELHEAFRECYGRIPRFSAWYFAYPTTWKLVGAAGKSAAGHAVSIGSQTTLAEAVSKDLQALVCQKYEALVLQPKLTDPKVHRAFVRSLQAAHRDYRAALGELEGSVATFVRDETEPVSVAPTTKDVVVDVDWKTQLEKVDRLPLAFEKSPQVSVALIGASLVGGKVAGAGSAAAATKALLGKLASPFVSKAVATATLGKGGGVAATAGIGGAVGGPAGAAVGAALGVAVDATLNAGVGLVQKGSFERDATDALDATMLEWEDNLWPALEQAQATWFDRVDALLRANPATKTITAGSANPSSSNGKS